MHIKSFDTKLYKNLNSVIHFLCICLIPIILLISCSFSPEANSGNYTIKGIITSTENNQPVSSVTVSVKGSSVSAITNEQGEYTLNNVKGSSVVLNATKNGLFLLPEFSKISDFAGNSINLELAAHSGIIENANFNATSELTISQIQGKGHMSPLEGAEVKNITGVVTYVGKVRGHYKFDSSTHEQKDALDQCVGEDGFYMQMVTPDGDPQTSDGIFVSTRNPLSSKPDSKTDWLNSCKPNGKYPKPGDVVTVCGIVEEFCSVNRFNNGLGNLTRTQINATSVKQTGKTQSIGNGVLITYTLPVEAETNPDAYRLLEFDSYGIEALNESSMIFESVEGMLVRVNNPIVTGGTYYNFTGIMADGGKDANGNYPNKDPNSKSFNEKWLAPVLRVNDFNAEQIHVWWDNQLYDKENDKDAPILAKLPQVGTILAQDGYTTFNDSNPPYLTGVMDYIADGNYIIYPFRNQVFDETAKDTDNNPIVPFLPHNEYNFIVNPESFYNKVPGIANYPLTYNKPADIYQPWIYATGTPQSYPNVNIDTFNPLFSVPWDMQPKGSESTEMSVAVFNLENYINQGFINISGYPEDRRAKQDNVARAIVKAMKCPDIIFVVEMGDDDDSSDDIIYNNQNHNWLSRTGVVSARNNYMGLIHVIEEFTRTDKNIEGSGIEYDYRQIDPKEFDQAGSPGNNIRVGFLFRTDRIEPHDIGLKTHNKEYGLQGLADKKDKYESNLIRLAEANAHLILLDDGENKELTLTQSPGYIQNDAFYHSRIPLICKFTFLPNNEDLSQDFFGIAAHLYSKGPDAPLYGNQQPPVFTSEIRRGNQAIALNQYIREMQRLDPEAQIIVAGDMNDFGYTPAVRKLTGEFSGNQNLYSLTERYLPEEERFTYYFRGNLQQLDHIFVTRNLLNKTDAMTGDRVFIPHIDSLFSRNNHIQISDHDPVVALIDMSK